MFKAFGSLTLVWRFLLFCVGWRGWERAFFCFSGQTLPEGQTVRPHSASWAVGSAVRLGACGTHKGLRDFSREAVSERTIPGLLRLATWSSVTPQEDDTVLSPGPHGHLEARAGRVETCEVNIPTGADPGGERYQKNKTQKPAQLFFTGPSDFNLSLCKATHRTEHGTVGTPRVCPIPRYYTSEEQPPEFLPSEIIQKRNSRSPLLQNRNFRTYGLLGINLKTPHFLGPSSPGPSH